MGKRCLGCMELYGDEFNICPHCGFVVGSVPEEPIHMVPGTVLLDRYIIGKVLGFGGFGVTYIAWDKKLEQKVAIKEYLPGEFSTRMPGQTFVTVFNGEKTEQYYNGLKKFVDEAKRLAKFQNEPGIVKIFDSFEENRTAYIVMEYLEGETLSEYLNREGTIPEDLAVDMLRPVMESLITVHGEGLIHRDIAPDNIFLTTSGEVKLIDFGASRYATTTHSRSLTVIVKPGYSPEEQYRSRGDQGAHTDVYAVSATLYKMITGKTPPDAMERRAKYEHENKDILEEPHKLKKDISVNREIAILNGLNVRIEDRTPDIATLIEELYADPPAKRRHGKIRKIDVLSWPLWVKIAVPVLMALLVTFGALILTGVINFSKYSREVVIPDNIVIAPDVEGMLKDEAFQQVENAKLLAVVTGSLESEYLAAGKIIIQRPVGGTFLEINGTISLMVSTGSGVEAPVDGVATVPYLVGDTREKAIEKCRLAGLGEPVFEEVEDEYVASGLIVSADIEAGQKVPEETVLHIKVSKGSAPIVMPDSVGQDAETARSILEGSGLMVSVEYEYSDSVPEGQIIRQSVPTNQEVQRGDKVTITVSTGEQLVVVENIVGRTPVEAEKILGNQGFAVYVRENTDEKVPAGAIISQSPEANSSQKKGSTITIFVSKGKKEINVSLDPAGGDGVTGAMVFHLDEDYSKLPTPTRTGYTFDGWYTGKSGGSLVSADNVVTQSSDHTLYAHWTANKYTVSLEANGGSVSKDSISVSYDSTYGDLPTPSRTGYTFEGWYNGGTKIDSTTKMTSTSDQTLNAKWTANSYTVSFNSNGGSVGSSTKKITFDSSYGDLPVPTYEGYVFTGWYTSPDGGSLVDSSTAVTGTSDQTLYAHWSAGNFKVNFDANGGTSSSDLIGATYNQPYGELPTASKTGYTFNGWFTDAKGGTQITSSSTVTSSIDHTLYAHWTANNYTVSLNANGGSVSSDSKSVTYDGTYGDLPSPSRTGYSFDGWFSSASGGSQISAKTAMTTSSNHTLYAHWTANTYTLFFNGNGGSSSQSSRQLTYNSSFGELPSASRDYYDFDGWYTAADGGSKVTSSDIINGNVTVYAHWTIHPTSDWVLASEMPSGAQVVEEQWTYTLTEYMQITSEEMKTTSITTDWMLYDKKVTDYGPVKGPVYTKPTGEDLKITSEQYTTKLYVYYHRYGQDPNDSSGSNGQAFICGTDASLSSGKRHQITVPVELDKTGTYTAYGVTVDRFGKYECPECGIQAYWYIDNTSSAVDHGTRWYYQEPIYTYYYSKEHRKVSSTDPSGSKDVSEILKYVKYRAK